jgi:hypothetical protein
MFLPCVADPDAAREVDRRAVRYAKPLLFLLVMAALLVGVRAYLRGSGGVASEATLSGEDEENALRKLESLPYLVWTPTREGDRGKQGVTVHVAGKAMPGLNVFKSRNHSEAHLMDMEGRILHTWKIPDVDIKHVEINPRGELFAIQKDGRLIKIDWRSRGLWRSRLRYHHDIHVEEGQDLYAFTRDVRSIQHKGVTIPILDDYITILKQNGEPVRRISIYDLLGDRLPEERLDRIAQQVREKGPIPARELKDSSLYDVFHSNSLERIDRNITGFAHEGDFLISIREIHTVAVVDLEAEEVVWSWGPGVVQAQHEPTLLDSGNLLVFDNGPYRGHSRVLEIDPLSRAVTWEYVADPPGDFFSKIRGGNQRLANGNTLITESDKGRVFEVTADGEIVWEFWNPETRENKRAAIYRMMRLDEKILARLPFEEAMRAELTERGYLTTPKGVASN